MSRDGSTKVTKYSFQKALQAGKSLTRIAADLGISVRTAQRYLTRFGINLARKTNNLAGETEQSVAPKPRPNCIPTAPDLTTKGEFDLKAAIMKRTLAAFSGPNRGDAGGHKSGSPQEVLDRHTRQKK